MGGDNAFTCFVEVFIWIQDEQSINTTLLQYYGNILILMHVA
jgi:dsDNA-specific endonuclease/ATPase MutS2